VTLDPESSVRCLEKGDALLDLGRKDEALASFRKARELLNRSLTGHIHYLDILDEKIGQLGRSSR
jgi:hypothetical protein